MSRLDIPAGPGGDAAMLWTLRPELAGMVERMIKGAYVQSIIPPLEREVARMRIAQLNDCVACSDFRAESMIAAGVPPEHYDHVAEWATWPGYSGRQRLAIEYAERFATAHGDMDDELFSRLRSNFSDAEILDLSLCVSVWIGLGRTLSVLGIEQSCAVEL